VFQSPENDLKVNSGKLLCVPLVGCSLECMPFLIIRPRCAKSVCDFRYFCCEVFLKSRTSALFPGVDASDTETLLSQPSELRCL
jgi:hypothetical protein